MVATLIGYIARNHHWLEIQQLRQVWLIKALFDIRRNEATLERKVIFIKFSSLTAPKAAPIDAILTNYDAASDENFVKTTI